MAWKGQAGRRDPVELAQHLDVLDLLRREHVLVHGQDAPRNLSGLSGILGVDQPDHIHARAHSARLEPDLDAPGVFAIYLRGITQGVAR